MSLYEVVVEGICVDDIAEVDPLVYCELVYLVVDVCFLLCDALVERAEHFLDKRELVCVLHEVRLVRERTVDC